MQVSKNLGALGSRGRGKDGTTVVEAVVCVAVIGIALGALMTLNGNQLRLVKVGRETNSASLVVQERVEKLRTISWPDLVDSSHMKSSFLEVDAKAAPILQGITEKVVISSFPASTSTTPMELKKTYGAAATVVNGGSGLLDEKLVRVDLTLGWKGADGQNHTRAISTLLAKSGVNRNDVPAMGPVSGGPFDAFNPPITTEPTTPPPTGTEVPAPTPEPTPTAPGNGNNGNGNGNNGNNGLGQGNGNVNGKNGKG
ncbi:MAG: hypothetical protein ACO1QR_02850 [Chthoniobacteraceae bacterium]